MTYLHNRVGWFHEQMGQKDPARPGWPSGGVAELRARLIAEEAMETVVALVGPSRARGMALLFVDKAAEKESPFEGDLMSAVVDGCVDTMVVCSGTLHAFGVIDDTPYIKAVMDANDAKVGGGRDEFNKWLKPPGWTPPDIAAILRKNGWRG